MSVQHVISMSLLVLGTAVTVLAGLALLRAPTTFDRLHLGAPVTSVGAPLIGLALIVDQGLSLSSGQVAVTALLLVASGPAATMAVARVEAQRRRGSAEDEPE